MNADFKKEVESGERFEFGKNWKDFLKTVNEEEIKKAIEDIRGWLPADEFSKRKIVDIGSGSGIHSLAFHKLGAKELMSFDYDDDSVEATKKIWQKHGSPANWKVIQGSILEKEFVKTLGHFDIVYSWGVLHHTGEMWKAIDNAISLLADGGLLWIAIYQKGPHFEKDLALKKRYNKASRTGKKFMTYKMIAALMAKRLLKGKNPFKWNEKVGRGMNVYNDIIDWLGGLPYEVADKEEIESFGHKRGLQLQKTDIFPEGGCSSYLFRKSYDI